MYRFVFCVKVILKLRSNHLVGVPYPKEQLQHCIIVTAGTMGSCLTILGGRPCVPVWLMRVIQQRWSASTLHFRKCWAPFMGQMWVTRGKRAEHFPACSVQPAVSLNICSPLSLCLPRPALSHNCYIWHQSKTCSFCYSCRCNVNNVKLRKTR